MAEHDPNTVFVPETPLAGDDSGHGNFSLNITLDESDLDLFITPNHLNETPTEDTSEDICDLLTAVSPIDIAIGGEPGSQFIDDDRCENVLQPPHFKPGHGASSPKLDDTIGDETLRQFEANLSLSSSGEESIPSLATRVKNKTGLGITRIKGRKSVSNPKQALDLSSAEDEEEDTPCIPVKPPLPPQAKEKGRFATVSEKELDSLQYDAKAKRTHQQTKWGVNQFKGK